MGQGDILSAYAGNMQKPGFLDPLLGPFKLANAVAERTKGPESMGAGALPLTPNAAPLMNMLLSFAEIAKEGQAQSVDTLQSAGMPEWLGALLKGPGGMVLDQGGMTSGTAASGVELSRLLMSLMGRRPSETGNPTEDAKKFLGLLGSTAANTLSLGLTGTPTKLAQATPGLRRMVGAPRGAQAAAKSAPAAAPPSDAIPVPRSEIVPENVFGETPGASAALPEKPTIPQSLAQKTGSQGIAMVERFMAASMLTAGDFTKLAAKQANAIHGWGTKLVESIGDVKGTLSEKGVVVKERIAQARQMMADEADAIWNGQVWNDPAMLTGKKDPWGNPVRASVKIDKKSTVAAAARNLLGDVDAEVRAVLKNHPEAQSIADVNPKLGERFQMLRNLASGEYEAPIKVLLKEKNRLFDSGGSDKFLSEALDTTIKAKVKELGGDALLSKFSKAKEMTRRLHTVEENALYKSITNGKSDAVADIFLGADPVDQAAMRNMLKPADVKAIVARKLQDAMETSQVDPALFDPFTGEAARSAAAAGENVSGKAPIMSGSKFANKVKNIGGTDKGVEGLSSLLSPAQRAALGDLVSTAQAAGVANWKNMSGMLVNSIMVGAATAIPTAMIGLGGRSVGTSLATLAVTGVGTKIISKILTNPEGMANAARVMRAYGNAAKKGVSVPTSDPQFMFWSSKLAKMAAQELDKDEKDRDLEGVASDLPGGGYVAR